jgi:regulator of replication initiation timing
MSLRSGLHSSRHETGAPASASRTVVLQERVSHQIANLQHTLASLKRELAEALADNARLSAERERAYQLLAQAHAQRIERRNAELSWQSRLREMEELESCRNTVLDENRLLTQRCAELMQALSAEQREREAAALEVEYLEQQLAELSAIVHVLLNDRDADTG